MRKRVWSILLAVCMVLALLPATALAANVLYSGRCGANASWVTIVRNLIPVINIPLPKTGY